MKKPLANLTLRTAGLASVKGAMFGMTRTNADGSPRAHQGVDFAVEVGTPIFAVADGEIVAIGNDVQGYGRTITLSIGDNEGRSLYAFYAHLSTVMVFVGDKVQEGDVLGMTGDSGNAKGMDTINKGAHLHFEIRTEESPPKGLAGRLNPLDFLEIA